MLEAGFFTGPDMEAVARAAGAQAYRLGYLDDTTNPSNRREHGAFIFAYDGACWAAPLTEGKRTYNNESANVGVGQMYVDMLRLTGMAGVAAREITIVSMVHSHPSQSRVSDIDQGVHHREALKKSQGFVQYRYTRTYVWGPSPGSEGRDPRGRLYSYP
jgi:hypothetical protein